MVEIPEDIESLSESIDVNGSCELHINEYLYDSMNIYTDTFEKKEQFYRNVAKARWNMMMLQKKRGKE